MAKTLKEIYDETVKAIEYNQELLRKCENCEPPYNGRDEDGKLIGGRNSKAWYAIFDIVINSQMMLDDLVRTMSEKKDPIKYENVVKNTSEHRCYSCHYISNIGSECVCKNPKMSINSVRGGITSNCLMKFDSYQHYWLKINPDRLACKNFKDHFEEEEQDNA